MKEQNIIYKETKQILKKCSWEIILKIIISVLYRGTLLIIPILWGKAIDLLTANQFHASCRFVLITLAVTIGYYISACLNQVIYYWLYNKMYQNYSELIYKSVVRNSLYSLSRFRLGEFSNVVNNDIDIIVAFISDSIIKLVRLLEFVIIFYYFYTIDFTMFIVTFILSVLMFLVLLFSEKKTKELNEERKYHLDKKVAITHEVFHTIKEIKGFFVFQNINERVKEVCSHYLDANDRYNTFTVVIKQIILCIIEVFRYALAIYGMYLCTLGKMEIGTILVIYTYYGKLTDNYDIIGTLMSGLGDFKVSLQRLNRLLEYRIFHAHEDDLAPKDYKGVIKFSNVLYGNKKDPILNQVTFKIDCNSITAITGNPGTGKTGVFDLLMKMNRKHQGDILIDGDDYEKISNDVYYNLVSIARKGPHFFDISIKDNLLLVEPDFEKVREVCQKLGIDEEIMSLKHKYDTQINDPSEKVSNNLRAAIAVARVILKNSKIMMFDEIISVLDSKHQEYALTLLKELSADHTIILITRDSHILSVANKVITFENNVVKSVRLVYNET